MVEVSRETSSSDALLDEREDPRTDSGRQFCVTSYRWGEAQARVLAAKGPWRQKNERTLSHPLGQRQSQAARIHLGRVNYFRQDFGVSAPAEHPPVHLVQGWLSAAFFAVPIRLPALWRHAGANAPVIVVPEECLIVTIAPVSGKRTKLGGTSSPLMGPFDRKVTYSCSDGRKQRSHSRLAETWRQSRGLLCPTRA